MKYMEQNYCFERGNRNESYSIYKMSNGKEMKIELYPEIAPNTVNNFISLVNKGFIMVLYSTE